MVYLLSGITPAYAGTTSLLTVILTEAPDHPRLRGDYEVDHQEPSMTFGSPPPTRGLPVRRANEQRGARITPAYAGTTVTSAPSFSRSTDHPRLRGDY
jgi:hypothetical protein